MRKCRRFLIKTRRIHQRRSESGFRGSNASLILADQFTRFPQVNNRLGFRKEESLTGGRPPIQTQEHRLKREMEQTLPPTREVWAGECVRVHRDSLYMGETSVATKGDPPRMTKPQLLRLQISPAGTGCGGKISPDLFSDK